AVGRVARATADGYTIGIGQYGNYVLNGAIYPLQYDLLKDFEPIALVASNPQVIVTKYDMPAKDLKELIAWLKANPARRHRARRVQVAPPMFPVSIFRMSPEQSFNSCPIAGRLPPCKTLWPDRST